MRYAVANRIYVKPEYTEEFEERFRNRVGQLEQQPGFVLMDVLKPHSETTPYVIMTYWTDKQAFTEWVKSEDFKLAHQNPMSKDAFLEGGGLEQYSVIISSETASRR